MKTAEQADNSMHRYGLLGKLGIYLVNESSQVKSISYRIDVNNEIIRFGKVRDETLRANFTKSHFRAKIF